MKEKLIVIISMGVSTRNPMQNGDPDPKTMVSIRIRAVHAVLRDNAPGLRTEFHTLSHVSSCVAHARPHIRIRDPVSVLCGESHAIK